MGGLLDGLEHIMELISTNGKHRWYNLFYKNIKT